LSSNELEVWDTYIRPFEPFEVDLDIIADLHFRSETDSLEDEEYELLERHHDWFVANSHQRLPFDRWCPAHLINRAQRYEKLIELKAPECIVTQEGRFLAEEMVLYYHCKKKLVFDSLKFIAAQMSTYETALKEIKSGKKRTHWMWFIFPQLRGLGQSEMSYIYGIKDEAEAKAYLANSVLGERLIEISSALLQHDNKTAREILGGIDADKLRSSMTLFAKISTENSVFHQVLELFYNGKMDVKTLDILKKEEI
jgi:uncharacterized protein (DUF1810 family)